MSDAPSWRPEPSVVLIIDDEDANVAELTVRFPHGIYGTVAVEIDVQPFGGEYATVVSDTFGGKSIDAYERPYEVPLTGRAPRMVRIRGRADEYQLDAIAATLETLNHPADQSEAAAA